MVADEVVPISSTPEIKIEFVDFGASSRLLTLGGLVISALDPTKNGGPHTNTTMQTLA